MRLPSYLYLLLLPGLKKGVIYLVVVLYCILTTSDRHVNTNTLNIQGKTCRTQQNKLQKHKYKWYRNNATFSHWWIYFIVINHHLFRVENESLPSFIENYRIKSLMTQNTVALLDRRTRTFMFIVTDL